MKTHPYVAAPGKRCSSCGERRSAKVHKDKESQPVPLKAPVLYMHTSKAVNRGHPRNRLFLVVAMLEGDPLAWKVDVLKEGLCHPAFNIILPATEAGILMGFLQHGVNDSEPTAWFKPDSFYEEVTLTKALQRAE